VRAWDDVDGTATADVEVEDITAGGAVILVVISPAIGQVAGGQRSQFVSWPEPRPAEIGKLSSDFANFRLGVQLLTELLRFGENALDRAYKALENEATDQAALLGQWIVREWTQWNSNRDYQSERLTELSTEVDSESDRSGATLSGTVIDSLNEVQALQSSIETRQQISLLQEQRRHDGKLRLTSNHKSQVGNASDAVTKSMHELDVQVAASLDASKCHADAAANQASRNNELNPRVVETLKATQPDTITPPDSLILAQRFGDTETVFSNGRNLAITFTGPDYKPGLAGLWNSSFTSTYDIWIDTRDPNWPHHLLVLDRLYTDGAYDDIVIAGHGSSNIIGSGAVTLTALRNPNSDVYKFFDRLGDKLTDDATIELRVCLVCSVDTQLIEELAVITGAKVIGYSDWYAVVPHGTEFTAYPDGTSKKTGQHTPLRESIWGWLTPRGGGHKFRFPKFPGSH
jgi:hypothetical protein